jgi:hypothetical protein
MDQSDDPRELERKINQAARITSGVSDPTTVERLGAWIEELRQRLRQRKEARRIKQEITQRCKGNLGRAPASRRPRPGVLASGGVRVRGVIRSEALVLHARTSQSADQVATAPPRVHRRASW